MKIVVTGSLGNISKPLTQELIQRGHAVKVISSKQEKQQEIEALGAAAAIGTLADVDFLAASFKGADVVYAMVPPNFAEADVRAYYRNIGNNYAQAIRQSAVNRVIYLSSYGAELDKGTGLILGAHDVEGILNNLQDVAVTIMRPTYFYYNFYSFLDMIKGAGVMMANYGGNDSIAMVSPKDIAAAVVEEIESQPAGRKVRYVASDELTGNEIAKVLGTAIGKPDLKWELITDEKMQQGMQEHGLPARLAADMVEMFASLHNGTLPADYYRNKPAVMGKVKLADFAKEFAGAFEQK